MRIACSFRALIHTHPRSNFALLTLRPQLVLRVVFNILFGWMCKKKSKKVTEEQQQAPGTTRYPLTRPLFPTHGVARLAAGTRSFMLSKDAFLVPKNEKQATPDAREARKESIVTFGEVKPNNCESACLADRDNT